MTSCNASNRATIHANLSLDLDIVYNKSEHLFGITLGLVGCDALKSLQAWFAITSVVPAYHIDVSFKKEVQPVSIRRCDHLLIVEGIGIAHYHSWLVDVLRLFWRLLSIIVVGEAATAQIDRAVAIVFCLINHYLLFVCAWEEHAIDLVTSGAIDIEVPSLKSLR